MTRFQKNPAARLGSFFSVKSFCHVCRGGREGMAQIKEVIKGKLEAIGVLMYMVCI